MLPVLLPADAAFVFLACAGPPKGFEVVGAEQASDADMSSSQAPAVKRAPTTSSTAAAPAGADTDELRAKAAGALQDTKEGIKARVQVRVVLTMSTSRPASEVNLVRQPHIPWH
jgi:hypothetical protein